MVHCTVSIGIPLEPKTTLGLAISMCDYLLKDMCRGLKTAKGERNKLV